MENYSDNIYRRRLFRYL